MFLLILAGVSFALALSAGVDTNQMGGRRLRRLIFASSLLPAIQTAFYAREIAMMATPFITSAPVLMTLSILAAVALAIGLKYQIRAARQTSVSSLVQNQPA